MTNQQPPRDRASRLPLLFGLFVIVLGAWAAWLTHSWILLAVAVAVAFFPARTYGSDVRSWARRQRGG